MTQIAGPFIAPPSHKLDTYRARYLSQGVARGRADQLAHMMVCSEYIGLREQMDEQAKAHRQRERGAGLWSRAISWVLRR